MLLGVGIRGDCGCDGRRQNNSYCHLCIPSLCHAEHLHAASGVSLELCLEIIPIVFS